MKNNKPFHVVFSEIYPNLEMRYAIKRETDVLNEFVQFSDNTRDIRLQSFIYEEIKRTNVKLLKYITDYERKDKENTMESSN